MPANNPSVTDSPSTAIKIRTPKIADAAAIERLVADSGVLDRNSCYCYLLLCRDFAKTCVVAETTGEPVGFATAYLPPSRDGTVFVWQIAIAASARRQGLALRMLHELLALPACREIQFVEATVSPSNDASRRLFFKLAESLQVPCHVETGFTAEHFGGDDHEEEELFRIGPLTPPNSEG